MLQPRESDLPALLLFLVVLPLVTYILLGIWSEAVKKKARISVIAQRVVEEAYRAEAMASTNAMPIGLSSSSGFHGCARCFAPATTRCSRCKSVRYCSGKCQIIHWRQGHKQECHQWNIPFNVSTYPAFQETVPEKALMDNFIIPFNGYCLEEPIDHDNVEEQSDGAKMVYLSEHGIKSPEKTKLRRLESIFGESGSEFDENISHIANSQSPSSTSFTEMSSEDVSFGYKSGTGNFKSPDKIHWNRDRSHKTAGDVRKGTKQSNSSAKLTLPDLEQYVLEESENHATISSAESELHQAGYSSNTETTGICHSVSSDLVKGATAYKKPPYTLTSLPQKSRENLSREENCQATEQNLHKEDESRVPPANISSQHRKENSSIGRTNIVTKKTSKLLKRNLVGLISDNKKYKMSRMLFPYEDLVKFFQCEVLEIDALHMLKPGSSLVCMRCRISRP